MALVCKTKVFRFVHRYGAGDIEKHQHGPGEPEETHAEYMERSINVWLASTGIKRTDIISFHFETAFPPKMEGFVLTVFFLYEED